MKKKYIKIYKNVLVSIIIKILRECNITNESQIHNIHENIFQVNASRLLYRNRQHYSVIDNTTRIRILSNSFE